MESKGQTTSSAGSAASARGSSAAQSAGASAPPTVVVRTSVVPLVLMVVVAIALAVGLLVSLGFNIYSASAYAQYFQTDAKVREAYHSGSKTAADKIAIVELSGVMLNGNGFTKKQIDHVRDDDSVKAVVLRVNTPGGAVSAADYLFHHLKKLRDERKIPVVVSMGSIAASGGYYVSMAAGDPNASAADEPKKLIFAEPTCITGSIGVIIPRYDLHDLLEKKLDITSDNIVSHQFKELGSWTKELTPPERAKLQQQVDLMFARFKEKVVEGRPMFAKDEDALNQVATGEVFTGEQAKDLMLVDDVGFIEDAIASAADLANLGNDNYRVVEYKSPPTLADALIGQVESPARPINTQAILEMATPRAYYLYSWLPPLSAQ